MSRAKENAELASKIRAGIGGIVTSDADSLETVSVGTNGQVLTADSSEPNGIKWADAGSSGLSAPQITDLTDSGESTLHYHASDRDLANATGSLSVSKGGTGATLAQDAINTLSAVSGASEGDVLTSVSGDAIWQTPSGAGIGDVSGPASSVDANLPSFSGTGGKTLQDSGIATSSVATLTGTQTLTNKTISSGSGWNGNVIAATFGGTGQTTVAKGDTLYASTTNVISRLPIGTSGQALSVSGAGIPTWTTSFPTMVFGTSVSAYDGGETITTYGSNSIGRTHPVRTESANSTVKIGKGTVSVPVSGNSPALWVESWVNTDYTTLGDSGWAAQGVNGALFQAFKKGGLGGVNAVIAYARGDVNTQGDIIGARIVGDGKDRSAGGPTTFCGVWGDVESPSTAYGFGCYSAQFDVTVNCTGVFKEDPFSGEGSGQGVTAVLASNTLKAANQASFGVAVTEGYAYAHGFYTGMYVSDCSVHALRLRGGHLGGSGSTQVGLYTQGNFQYGIQLSSNCSSAGIALGPNKFNWGNGSAAGSVGTNGDMLYNEISGILYMNQLGATKEILCTTGAGTSGSYTADRKVAIKINGTTYYLLAATTA